MSKQDNDIFVANYFQKKIHNFNTFKKKHNFNTFKKTQGYKQFLSFIKLKSKQFSKIISGLFFFKYPRFNRFIANFCAFKTVYYQNYPHLTKNKRIQQIKRTNLFMRQPKAKRVKISIKSVKHFSDLQYKKMSNQLENHIKKEKAQEQTNIQLIRSQQTLQYQNEANQQSLIPPSSQCQKSIVDANFQEDIMKIYNDLMRDKPKVKHQEKNLKNKIHMKQLKKDVKKLKYEQKCQLTILRQFNQLEKEEIYKIIKAYETTSTATSNMTSYRNKRKFYCFKNIVIGVYQLLQNKHIPVLLVKQISFLEDKKKELLDFAKLLAIKFDETFLEVCNNNDKKNSSRKYQNQWENFEKNFMDPQNTDFRKKVICEYLKPEEVALMTQQQMYSPLRLKRIAQTKLRLMKEFEKPLESVVQKEQQIQIGYGVRQAITLSQITKNMFDISGKLILTPKNINLQAKAFDLQTTLNRIKQKWKKEYDDLQQPQQQQLKIHFQEKISN